MIFIIVMLLICIAASFFFAGSETGFISWNPLKIRSRAEQGIWSARIALYLLHHKNIFLSMILIGNNIAIVGASLTFSLLLEYLQQYIVINELTIALLETAFLSPLLVIFSEMLPKSLYRIYSFRLTYKSIPLLISIYWLLYPLSWFFTSITEVFNKKKSDLLEENKNIRREMISVSREAERQGIFSEYFSKLISDALEFDIRKRKLLSTENETSKGKFFLHEDETVEDALHKNVFQWGREVPVVSRNGNVNKWIKTKELLLSDNSNYIRSLCYKIEEISWEELSLQFFLENSLDSVPFVNICTDGNDKPYLMSRRDLCKLIFV